MSSFPLQHGTILALLVWGTPPPQTPHIAAVFQQLILSLYSNIWSDHCCLNSPLKIVLKGRKKSHISFICYWFMKKEQRYLFYSVLGFWLACTLTSPALLAGTEHRETRMMAMIIGSEIWTIRGQGSLIKLFLPPAELKFLIILWRQPYLGKIQQSYLYQKPEGFHFSSFFFFFVGTAKLHNSDTPFTYTQKLSREKTLFYFTGNFWPEIKSQDTEEDHIASWICLHRAPCRIRAHIWEW